MSKGSPLKNPVSIAGRYATSKSAKQIPNAGTRRPQQSPGRQLSIQRIPDDRSTTVTRLASGSERVDTADAMSEEAESPNASLLQTPGPRPSVSRALEASSKRRRVKTSHIHEHISTRDEHFICNRCARSYKISGGTGAISRHLKKAHSIGPAATDVAENRPREEATIDPAIRRGAEFNNKAEEKRKERLMSIGLNKKTLEHLYLQWTISENISFKQVSNAAFRNFLDYVNPVANQIIPNYNTAMDIHAESSSHTPTP